MDFKKLLVSFLSLVALCGLVTARPGGIVVNISENITSLTELGTFMTGLVGIGITLIIYILQKLPEIAIYVFIAAFIIAILYMIRQVFGYLAGFFKNLGGATGKLKP